MKKILLTLIIFVSVFAKGQDTLPIYTVFSHFVPTIFKDTVLVNNTLLDVEGGFLDNTVTSNGVPIVIYNGPSLPFFRVEYGTNPGVLIGNGSVLPIFPDGSRVSDSAFVCGGDSVYIKAKRTKIYGELQLYNASHGNGKVLMSDAIGYATWVTDTSLVNGLAWGLTGNTGTNGNTNYVGTSDSVSMTVKSWYGNISNQSELILQSATPSGLGVATIYVPDSLHNYLSQIHAKNQIFLSQGNFANDTNLTITLTPNTQTLRFGGTTGPSWSYNFPAANGLTNQIMINNGSNVLSWGNALNIIDTGSIIPTFTDTFTAIATIKGLQAKVNYSDTVSTIETQKQAQSKVNYSDTATTIYTVKSAQSKINYSDTISTIATKKNLQSYIPLSDTGSVIPTYADTFKTLATKKDLQAFSGGIVVHSDSIHLTSAQILALNVTPVQLEPGIAGHNYQILSIREDYHYLTTGYRGSGAQLNITQDNTLTGTLFTDQNNSGGSIVQGATSNTGFFVQDYQNGYAGAVRGDALTIYSPVALTGGAGSVDIFVTYIIQ